MAAKRPAGDPLEAAAAELLAYAHSLPGAWEDHPWPGETVAKVGKKVFVFSGRQNGDWGLSVKLMQSHAEATALPFTEPTGYGLGRAGWISARFKPGEKPLVGLLKTWVRESYALIAPKKLAAQLEAPAAKPKRAAPARTAPKPRTDPRNSRYGR